MARRSVIAVRVLVLTLTAVTLAAPLRGVAKQPSVGVIADVQRDGQRVRIASPDGSPYGRASLNGRPLEIRCLEAMGSVGITYLLTPILRETVVVLKARERSGRLLWITILKKAFGKPRMSIRTSPGENWGWCGTGGSSFYEARKGSGYVIVAP